MRALYCGHHTCSLGLVLALLSGCSGDGDSGAPASQGEAANGALARKECYLGLQVPDVNHTGFACSGTDTSSTVSGYLPNVFEPALSVSLALAEPPAIGELDLTSLSVNIPDGDLSPRWDAPLDACSAVAVATAHDSDFDWDYYRIDISCSLPAQPASDNPGQPLELGEFVIVVFFSPAP